MNIFDIWNQDKQKLEQQASPSLYLKVREIWFTKMGKNIGFEEDGKEGFLRPVLVLKKIGTLFLTIALTSRGKKNHRFYHHLKTAEFNLNNQKYKNQSYVILSQIKVMDKKRFTEKMGMVGKGEFKAIKEKLKEVIL